MIHIEILIINWNAGTLITDAVESILGCDYPKESLSVIVIDNASTDGSVENIPPHPSVKIIRNKKNVGFAAACNQGYLLAKGDYFLLLNPDTKLFIDTLTKSVQFMEQNANISILGVKHLDDMGIVHPSCSRFPTLSDFLILSIGLNKVFPKFFKPPIIMMDYDYEKGGNVDQVMGAYMFMRMRDIDRFGLKMDERFFLYYEDLDFSKQLREAGGLSYYTPSISIIHAVNGTTNQIKDRRLFYNIKSRLQYSKKYFNEFELFLISIFSLLIEPFCRITQLLFKGKMIEIKEVLKGYWMIYANLIGLK